jgi:hypothetical protein
MSTEKLYKVEIPVTITVFAAGADQAEVDARERLATMLRHGKVPAGFALGENAPALVKEWRPILHEKASGT